jgi:hypothetical protein
MNRYVVRALVAVLTFCIGVAVGRGPHRPTHQYERSCRRAVRLGLLTPGPVPLPQERTTPYGGPFLSIDTAQSDPLKLSYSSTTPAQVDSGRQHVEFLVNKFSGKGITNYTVSYVTFWGRRDSRDVVEVFVRKASPFADTETFGLECDSKETLTVWVSRVQFKDGTSWENPRHRVGQPNL